MKEHQSANAVTVNRSRWPLIIGVLGLAVAVCACSIVPAPVVAPTDIPQLYLGDVVEQYGYSLSATAIEDPAIPSWMADLEPGEKLVAIEIIVGNVSGETLSVNPLYATLIDSEGFSYDVDLGGRDGSQVATADLSAGEKVKGWVAFAVPENATPASLKYEIGLWSGKVLQVGLTPTRES